MEYHNNNNKFQNAIGVPLLVVAGVYTNVVLRWRADEERISYQYQLLTNGCATKCRQHTNESERDKPNQVLISARWIDYGLHLHSHS